MRTKKKKLLPKLLAAGVILALIIAGAAYLPGVWRSASFNWTERSDAERTVKAYADAHGIAYGTYPESLIDLLERNPETE